MKVLHVTGAYVPSTAYGGPIISTHDLVRAQARLGAEVEVLSTDADGRTRLPAGTAVVDGVRVHYFRTVPLNRHGIAPALIAAMRRVPEFDVVHCHGTALVSTTAAAWAALLCRRSVVVSPHGSLMAWARGKKAWRKRAYGLLDLVPFRRALFHATSDIEAEDVRTLGFRACIVPNAVDVDAFAAPAAFDVRAELGIPRDVPLIAWIGRFDPVKNLELLLECLPLGDAHVVLGGDPDNDYGRAMRALALRRGAAGNVHLLGYVGPEKKVALLQQADAYAATSHMESYGLSIAEALAAGCPVVATTGTPWRVLPEVGAGEWVEPAVPAFAAALRGVLSSRGPERRARASAAASAHAWPQRAAEMLRQYEALMRTPRGELG